LCPDLDRADRSTHRGRRRIAARSCKTGFYTDDSLSSVVEALQALRGINLISAVTFMVEIGDLNRFDNPRQLTGYLGLVPSERSTGDRVRRGSITKAGNGRIRGSDALLSRAPGRIAIRRASAR